MSDFTDPGNPRKEVAEFLGVPYAEPPTGANRFQPPVPVNATRNTTVDARNYKNSCMQDQVTLTALVLTATTTNDGKIQRITLGK